MESIFYGYGVCIFLMLLALYNVKNIITANTRIAKIIHVIISLTLFLLAVGFVYIHLLIYRHKEGL